MAQNNSGNNAVAGDQGNQLPEVPTGGVLNASQLRSVAAMAGFSEPDLTTAVAVALAESGGNSSAYNPETAAGTPEGKGSYGLWQIYLKAHPELEGMNLNDPQTNANAAFYVYQNAGGNFKPWSTFKNGSYQAFLDQAQGMVNV